MRSHRARARTAQSESSFSIKGAAIPRDVDEHQKSGFSEGNELAEGWLTQFGTDKFARHPQIQRAEFDVSTLCS